MSLSNALLSGQVDILTSVNTPDAIVPFENNSKYLINNGASTHKQLLAFNDRIAPFNNIQVRKAIYSAIDRQKLLNSVWGKYGALIGSMVPPTDAWYDPALVNANPYDVNLAKSLLASAGYPNGFTFTLEVDTEGTDSIVGEFVKSELAKVGVTVILRPTNMDEWYSKVYTNKNFEATIMGHVNDRDVVWYGNPDFYWGYTNNEVIKLVGEADQSATTEEQTQKLLEVNRIIAREAASVWLFLHPHIVVSDARFSGYPINGLNTQFYVYNIVRK
jgi:peptide/nickel transport system substrate-binding protein